MNLLDFSGTNKKDREAILNHYQDQNKMLLNELMKTVADYILHNDQVGIAYLVDTFGAVFRRAADQMGGDCGKPETIMNWPKNLN